jgi:hypothetical protein
LKARWWPKLITLAILCQGLTGCLHRRVKPFAPKAALTPVDLIVIPEPSLPLLQRVAPPKLPVPLASRIDRDLKRLRRRSLFRPGRGPASAAGSASGSMSGPAPAPSIPVAVATPPETVAIGSLTVGDDSETQKRQAAEVIADNERRLRGLSADVIRAQESQLTQVRDFEKKAQAALNAGDANGALTLATKARVLLDDLLK